MATKTIAVTGDLLTDHYLVKHGSSSRGYGAPLANTLQFQQPGGAWFLHEMVQLSMQDLTDSGSHTVLGPRHDRLGRNAPVGNAYALWSPFPRSSGDKKKVWRIAEFLGSVVAENIESAKAVSLVAHDDDSDVNDGPEILVLDDVGLGFAVHENLWPSAIRPGSNDASDVPHDIVLKTSHLSKANELLDHLLCNFADQLTLVIGLNDLRARGAAISKGLSWDRTIEETVKEFDTGLSSCDLARAKRIIVHLDGGVGVACFTRTRLKLGPAKPGSCDGTPVRDRVCFERFLYLPDAIEGSAVSGHPGAMFGRSSIITASVARHIADPDSYPLFVALARGLAASRHNSSEGGGASSNERPRIDQEGISSHLHGVPKSNSWSDYYTAFPHQVLTDPTWRQQPASQSNLLRDAVGPGDLYYMAVAMDIVVRSPEKGLLRSVPKARYGHFMTVDREEIERINALRGLIENYRSTPGDKRPLSISVFGPPGSGKSFAIKQLAAAMFGKDQQTLEFNLSQFGAEGVDQLHGAFHQVRDASIKGAIPLVFWDEFDSDDLQWLKHFLAPMQDAEFRAGTGVHPFGKAIFVFAGGTCENFEAFDRSDDPDADVQTFFRARKGPDFVSRLRGFVNIKGPNPMDADRPESDPEFMIRRAMILRSLLERSHGQLIDGKSNMANVSTRVIRAFLRAKKFLHGARSLEYVLRMSDLRDETFFDVSSLTTPELLGLHVTPDFVELASRPEVETEIVEALSKAFHEGWRKMKEAQGWTYGESRDDDKQEHPLLIPFDQLDADGKRKNFDPAIVTLPKLAELGYVVRRRRATISESPATSPWTGTELHRLKELEHDIWVRAHALRGYEYADSTNDALRLHRDMTHFEDLPDDDKTLDIANIESITHTLHEYGYELVRR